MPHSHEMTADQKKSLEKFQGWLSKVNPGKEENGNLLYEANEALAANLLPLLKDLGLDVWTKYNHTSAHNG